MLSHTIFKNMKNLGGFSSQRNIGILAPSLQKATDPIQQLFLDKLREYKQKSDGGKKLVEPSPDIERELASELDKVTKVYGGAAGGDMTKFPSLKFVDPVIDPITMENK